MRYFLRFVLLAIAFALTTWGLLRWQVIDYSFANFFDWSSFPVVHPIFFVVFGISLIPPTIWDIFLLEKAASDD